MKNKKCATGVKKVAVKKYAEGGTVESSAPKKMNFVKKFINKQREKEQAFQDYSDAEDAQSFKDAGVTRPVAIEKMSVKTPSIESKESFASKKLAPVADTTSVKSDKPIGWNDEGEKERVAAYQKRHGLKADGVWGKETKDYFDASQKAKAAPKKMAVGKNSKYDKLELPEVKLNDGSTGKRDAVGNTYYKNDRVVGKGYKGNINPESIKQINDYEKSPVRAGATKTEVVAEKPKSSTMATGYKGKDGNMYFSNGRTYNPTTGEKGSTGDGSVFLDKDKGERSGNMDGAAFGRATRKNNIKKSNLSNELPSINIPKVKSDSTAPKIIIKKK